MAVKANTTLTTNFEINPREVDFVTRFGMNWQGLLDIIGIARPIKKTPGTVLTAKEVTIELQSGDVAEGDEIPYSLATISEKDVATLKLKKYSKGITIEDIDKYGYDVAVQKTDDAFLNKLQGEVMDNFYTVLGTGTLTGSKTTFQQALANAKGLVTNQFKKLRLDMTEVVGFVNVMDFYDYLGDANITVQNEFGMNYIKNFMGYNTIFLLSDGELEAGKVIATPVENLALYYLDAADSDFARAGLEYTVDGVTNLIGFHTEGKYSHAVSECYAIMGATMFAEYLNGIAVVTFGAGA
jgi:hypothetical protein